MALGKAGIIIDRSENTNKSNLNLKIHFNSIFGNASSDPFKNHIFYIPHRKNSDIFKLPPSKSLYVFRSAPWILMAGSILRQNSKILAEYILKKIIVTSTNKPNPIILYFRGMGPKCSAMEN